LKVTILPLRKTILCGEPILASAFTLGQLPVYFPDKYYYQFELIGQGDTTLKRFELSVSQRYWFWDMFLFGKNFSKKHYLPITIHKKISRQVNKSFKKLQATWVCAMALRGLAASNKKLRRSACEHLLNSMCATTAASLGRCWQYDFESS
jgi:hypothetical protein